ncbi:hypothetical protein Mgra_00007577 [Meloidogyne graminicola]|uniref:Uncharacterized protein n=1 Tax=Meloidogyne graminicola TaxID=189291 RepID=A0A8S9ZI23_9BILA|nr:hypothetical protein Mgra_00007577 [Meloidogyne graminicola]
MSLINNNNITLTTPTVRFYWINTTKPFQVIYVFIVMTPLIIAQLILIVLLPRLIFLIKCSSSTIKLSFSMWTYFLFHLFCTFTCLAYPICEFIRWKSLEETIRTFDLRTPNEQIILFWTGIWQLNYYACAPIATFILMLDRCLIIWFSNRNVNKYSELLIKWIGTTFLVICYLTSLIFYLNELPLNQTSTQTCRYVDCLMTIYQNRFQLFIKNMFSISNLICCIFFFWSLKHFSNQSQTSAKILKNRMVKFAIYMEILFEVIPGAFFNFLFIIKIIYLIFLYIFFKIFFRFHLFLLSL